MKDSTGMKRETQKMRIVVSTDFQIDVALFSLVVCCNELWTTFSGCPSDRLLSTTKVASRAGRPRSPRLSMIRIL